MSETQLINEDYEVRHKVSFIFGLGMMGVIPQSNAIERLSDLKLETQDKQLREAIDLEIKEIRKVKLEATPNGLL